MMRRLPRLSAVSWMTAEKVVSQALWLILFAILAPILGPRPYGQFSIVMVFIGLCDFVLADGAVEALVTVTDLNVAAMATANLANAVIALVLGGVLLAAAPVLSTLFGDPELAVLIQALTPLPILSLLSAVPIAMLRRDLLYKRLAVRTIVALTMGGLCGIAAGLAGWGVKALVAQVLAQRVTELVIAWTAVPARFRFGWTGGLFREMRRVAVHVYTARIMSFGGAQLPRLLIGYLMGAEVLGLYVLANRFLDVITTTAIFPGLDIGRVEMRTMTPGTDLFFNRFARMTRDTAILAFPILLGAAVMLPDLFHMWLDQRWAAGITPGRLIMLSGLPMVFAGSFDAAFLAARHSGLYARTAMWQAVSTVVTVVLCAPFGLDIMCVCLAIRPWLLMPMLTALARRHLSLDAWAAFRPPFRSLAGAMLMAGLLSPSLLRPDWLDPRVTFCGLILLGVVIYGLWCQAFTRDPLRQALQALFLPRAR
jgi:O-antigen/teichoic acid export membrane protein